MRKVPLSIVIPTFDEAGVIREQLVRLQVLRSRGVEVVVADGGSTDRTRELAAPLADAVVLAHRGRAAQMNAGAQHAHGDVLLFLHADTRLPERADELIVTGLGAADKSWGRFDVQIEGSQVLLRIVGMLMNWRSRLTGIATGDQAIFVRRGTFERCDGFRDIPLMEDIALSRRLKWFGRPLCLRGRVITSGRRWQRDGAMRTIVLMWCLRLAYFFGADPARLALRYDHARSER
ncbi:MAG: TIGR04283 family arsenosugar biosynthesis glycosyltransferase [Proteobacteria bacterium]|jgi:rSAM/selenodomain-associated transferase 2|nr:TIGR04283 family arsenosugar biosynthesis glycosyltransferase [Pseudomonadota bacterium]